MSHERFYFILCFVLTSVIQTLGREPQKIVGGQLSNVDELPYQVSLRVYNNHFCGGTLVSPQIVLTAAHCIYEIENNYLLNCGNISAVAGSIDSFVGGFQRRAVNCKIHPHYVNSEHKYYPNDIAAIVLEKGFKMGRSMKYLLLALPKRDYTNQIGVVSGWGKLSFTDRSSNRFLLKLRTRILSRTDCQKRVSLPDNIHSTHICTLASRKYQGTCQGDSGGPLVVNNTLVGIVSFGFYCGLGHPDVLTSVSKYWKFIRDVMQMVEDNRKIRQAKTRARKKKQLAHAPLIKKQIYDPNLSKDQATGEETILQSYRKRLDQSVTLTFNLKLTDANSKSQKEEPPGLVLFYRFTDKKWHQTAVLNQTVIP